MHPQPASSEADCGFFRFEDAMDDATNFCEFALGERAACTPKTMSLKVGNLEITAGGSPDHPAAFHRSRVLIDGKPFPVRSITIKGDVNSDWTVEMEFFPYNVEVRDESR